MSAHKLPRGLQGGYKGFPAHTLASSYYQGVYLLPNCANKYTAVVPFFHKGSKKPSKGLSIRQPLQKKVFKSVHPQPAANAGVQPQIFLQRYSDSKSKTLLGFLHMWAIQATYTVIKWRSPPNMISFLYSRKT